MLSMKKKEHALVTIAPEYGFGSTETKRDLATVPANSTLTYDIELVEFVKVKLRNHPDCHSRHYIELRMDLQFKG